VIFRNLIIGAMALGLLAGCKKYDENKVSIKEDADVLTTQLEDFRTNLPQDQRDSNVRANNGIWVGAEVVSVSSKNLIPKRFEGARGFVFSSGETISFEDIIYSLTRSTGIRVFYAPEVEEVDVEFADGFAYEGPLSRFLDSVASASNVDWSYDPDNNSIEFYQYVTRAFRVHAFGNAVSSSATAGAVSTSASVDLWAEIVAGVEAIIGGAGTVQNSSSSGYLVITTTPRRMRLIRNFLEQQNRERLRQLVVHVGVYNVTLEDSQAVGVDLSLAFQRLGSKVGITTPTGLGSVGGISTTFAVLDGDEGPTTKPGVYLKGSQVAVQALGKLGDVSVMTTASLTTLNDQPVPLNVGKTRNYVSASTTTLSETGGAATVTSSTSTVTEGLDIVVRPRILPDNRVRLELSLALNEVEKFTVVGSGAGTVQLPEVATRNFLNQVVLDNGDTLVLSGYEKTSDSASRQGITPALWVLGGNTRGSDERSVVVLTVQPIILESADLYEVPATALEG
jgi:type II secretory pathway component GspD/PulD (secretin)